MELKDKKARVFDIMKESEILAIESQTLQKEINVEEKSKTEVKSG